MSRRSLFRAGLFLILFLLLSCSKSKAPTAPTTMTDKIAEGVEKTFKHSKKRNEILSLVRDMDTEITSFTSRTVDKFDELVTLDSERAAQREQFDSLAKGLATDRRETMARIAKIRITMRSKMSKTEWDEVHAHVKAEK